MKGKRKRNSAAFKAKVAMETMMRIKTVAQIARENSIHPIQVSQWKTFLRERMPDFFGTDRKETENQEELFAAFMAVKKSAVVLWWGLFCWLRQCINRLLVKRRNMPMIRMDLGLRTRHRSFRCETSSRWCNPLSMPQVARLQ